MFVPGCFVVCRFLLSLPIAGSPINTIETSGFAGCNQSVCVYDGTQEYEMT